MTYPHMSPFGLEKHDVLRVASRRPQLAGFGLTLAIKQATLEHMRKYLHVDIPGPLDTADSNFNALKAAHWNSLTFRQREVKIAEVEAMPTC